MQKQSNQLVLLVEDNLALSDAVGQYLETLGYDVDFASNGLEALRLAGENKYDAIVLDVGLPKLDGISFCRRLRSEVRRSVPVLMLTARDTLEDKIAGLEAGADDYLTKPFATQELHARLKALMRRERRELAADVLRVGDLSLDTQLLTATRAGVKLPVSPIGRQILQILLRASPGVVSRQDIEREIWGDELPESDTLRSHMYNLRKAIDRPFPRPLLHTVMSFGFRIAELPEAGSVNS